MKLDLRGEVCPYPAVHTVEALDELRADEELIVHVDHRPALATIPWQAAKRGYLADVHQVQMGEWQVTLRRTSRTLDPLAIVQQIALQIERDLNNDQSESEGGLSGLSSLTPEVTATHLSRGVIALDVRWPADFGAAHLPRSINVTFSHRQFAQRVALLIPSGTAVLLVGNDLAQLAAAGADLQATGRYEFLGYLAGGVDAWSAAGLPLGRLAQMTIHEMRESLAQPGRDLAVLDVREPFEWEELGHLAGAIFIPLGELARRFVELPRNRRLAVVCEQGLRSSTAASLLAHRGFVDLVNVAEGMAGWRRLGYPLTDELAVGNLDSTLA